MISMANLYSPRAKQTSIPPYLHPLFSYCRACECLPESGVSGYAPGATWTGGVLWIQWMLKLFSHMFDRIWHKFSSMYICSSSKGLSKGCNGSFLWLSVWAKIPHIYIYISVELNFMRLRLVNAPLKLTCGCGNIFVSEETFDLCAETYWLVWKFIHTVQKFIHSARKPIHSARKLITMHANLFSCAEVNLTPRIFLFAQKCSCLVRGFFTLLPFLASCAAMIS